MNAKAVLIVGVMIIAGLIIYFYLTGGHTAGSDTVVPTPTSIPQKFPVVGASTTPVDTTVPAPTKKATTAQITDAVRAGLITEHGKAGADMTITISSVEGDYAKGMASAQGGGGIWFAAKTSGQWQLVWDGNGIITCAVLAKYPDFPLDMIPQCYDADAQIMASRSAQN